MGIANLLLAREALQSRGQASDPWLRSLEEAEQGARAALERDAILFLAGLRERRRRERTDVAGGGTLYRAFALEKACLFADVETFTQPIPLGAVPGTKPDPRQPPRTTHHWYVALAEWLLATQTKDGGWTVNAEVADEDRPNVIDTSFGLLILLRSSGTLHPTTPTEIDPKPRGPVTPRGEPPPPK
jgi:hypothetical protein